MTETERKMLIHTLALLLPSKSRTDAAVIVDAGWRGPVEHSWHFQAMCVDYCRCGGTWPCAHRPGPAVG